MRPSPTAAGAPLALLVLAGGAIGGALGQPSAGILGGVGLGALLALWLWWRERRRIGR